MFTEATCRGVGFGLGFAMTADVAMTQVAGSPGGRSRGSNAARRYIDSSVDFTMRVVPSSRSFYSVNHI